MPTRTPRDFYEEAKKAAFAHFRADFPKDVRVWENVLEYLDQAFAECEYEDAETNFIGALLEKGQRDGFGVKFEIEDVSPDPTDPQFCCTCHADQISVEVVGKSKKEAKRAAAAEMLRSLVQHRR